MATSATKLKQSSIDSFLLPNQLKPAPSPSPSPSSASSYELVRLQNIRRNQEFFQKLGISKPLTTNPEHKSSKPISRKTSSFPPAPAIPVRRSNRKRPNPLKENEENGTNEEAQYVDSSVLQYTCEFSPNPKSPCQSYQEQGGHETHQETPYIDSSVCQYTCDFSQNTDNPSLSSHSTSNFPISGFRVTGKSMQDPSLTKIYALDVCSFKNREKNSNLIAAGGHGGFISIYGMDFMKQNEEGEIQRPLMSWKSSKSWVSGVLFLEENPMFLVSSSNDGEVVVWDVGEESSMSPPIVEESKGLHSNGIFCMDQMNGLIATASKDSSVGVCRVTSEGKLVNERRIDGHHLGVIRGVCFRDNKEILADCGADGRICILDTRVPQPCILTIDSAHSTGVNTVEWCPSNQFLLLSASKDPSVLLYDVRNSTEPVHKLQGHVESNVRTCYQIYKPTFIDNGMAIATPGQGSRKISIYNVDTGNLISQGLIGYDANLVLFTSRDAEKQRLWAAGKQIHQLCPMRLPPPVAMPTECAQHQQF